MSPERLEIPEGEFGAFIYDCDGTLVDTMPLHYEAWVYSLRANGARFPFSEDDFYGYAGMKEQETARILNEKFSANMDPERVYAVKEEFFLGKLDKVAPIPAVLEHARYWKDRVPIAVASGSPRHHVERYLTLAGIRDLFPLIFTFEDVERGKPAPDMFLLAATTMGVAPADCLVFEDGQGGWTAAEAAGMRYVKVPRRALDLIPSGF